MRSSKSKGHRAIVARRDCGKLIRFSPEELRIVVERARAAGRPPACYIRESSLGATPRARRTELSDSLVRALTQVTIQLTRLSAAAKEQQLAGSADFEGAVSDVLAFIRLLD